MEAGLTFASCAYFIAKIVKKLPRVSPNPPKTLQARIRLSLKIFPNVEFGLYGVQLSIKQ